MDLGLKDKVIVITGGAEGIGAAIVEACAAEGAVPVIANRESSAGRELVDRLGAQGARCDLIIGELAEPASCERVVQQTLQQHGRIDGLVNNAGVNDAISLESGEPDAFLNSLKSNLWHYYSLAHFALPALKQSHGAIVNISSKVAVTGQGGTSAYAAAKGAQLALTREWAVELLPFGIRVNAVLPAEVMTPLYRRWLANFDDPEEKLRSITSNIPLGRRMTYPSEIASMVVYLLSEQASHITGQHMFVDGGYAHLDRSAT